MRPPRAVPQTQQRAGCLIRVRANVRGTVGVRGRVRVRGRVMCKVRFRLWVRLRVGGGVVGSVLVATPDSVRSTCIELQLSHAKTSYPFPS